MKTIDLPNGTNNLSFADFTKAESYIVEYVFDNDKIIISKNKISCCCNSDNKLRIHFVNYLGRIGAINFNHKEESFETKSDSWQKSLGYPLVKSEGGNTRMNIKSNESYKASNICYSEEDMNWIKELLSSPRAWIEWKGTENQPDDYIPIEITDKKFLTLKNEERYKYEVVIEFSMSNENIHLRN